MSQMSHETFDLSPDQAAVFQAVSQLESSADGPGHLPQIAREAGVGPERARQVLDELTRELGLVIAMDDPRNPDEGPFYRVQSLR
ncbi:hypothetical protein GCM10010156_30070 [Planobispora rosea]|uniref:Uncharacterized protein n=2 Tax=Planobispora rosea TaxID=35762 RepID=A0A8J3RY02_PLARO|nr:hypothetical protein [Planobispora rosea]GGS69101.1 hypothetical protein GCM10010156_30070 [Planobispora rosea]GIH82092.1 hypothetical protein Pro02_05000 [Planobispora rosea]